MQKYPPVVFVGEFHHAKWYMMQTVLQGLKGTASPVLIGYSLGMQLSNFNPRTTSKHSFKRKQKQQERYNQNYHLIRYQGQNRDTRILISHCDICNKELPKEADNIQFHIKIVDEIDDSFESEYDKHEPRLLLCSFAARSIIFPVIVSSGNMDIISC